MKKCFRQTFLAALLCIMMITATGCGSDPAPSASSGTPAPSSSSDSTTPEASASAESEEVECNWLLEVSDTQTSKVNGYDFTCTLTISAEKSGGKDEMGSYTGTASIQYEYKKSSGGISGNAEGSGQDNNAVFDVVAYDVEQFADAAGPDPLAPLIPSDTMALGSLNLTGTGLANESAGGADWSTSDSKTVAAPFRMAVDGGQVIIELYTIAPGVLFKGILTGTPI
jgi:hypothetical protein